MRDFKFRVFYKGHYTYFDFNKLNQESRAFYQNEIAGRKIEQAVGPQNVYEGDIISYFKGKYTQVVEYKNGHFIMRVVKPKKYKDDFFFFTDMAPDLIKVIGNIHENKELLED